MRLRHDAAVYLLISFSSRYYAITLREPEAAFCCHAFAFHFFFFGRHAAVALLSPLSLMSFAISLKR